MFFLWFFFQSDIEVNGCILCLNAVVLNQNRDCDIAIFYPWYLQEHEQERGAREGFLYGVVDTHDQSCANCLSFPGQNF